MKEEMRKYLESMVVVEGNEYVCRETFWEFYQQIDDKIYVDCNDDIEVLMGWWEEL